VPNATNVVKTESRIFRFALLFLLGLTEMMPVMFIMQALPVLMRRSGASLEDMGLLYVVMVPWALKVLWAPLVDRFGSRTIGRYRAWLLFLHPALVSVLVVLAFSDLERVLIDSPAAGLSWLAALSALAATADIASHGVAVNILAPHERGPGNVAQATGMLFGYLLGGGVMLMLLERFSWRTSVLGMAAVVALPMVAIWFFRERSHIATPPTYRQALAFFRLDGMWRWLCAMGLLTMAISVVNMPLHAALVDRGMDLAQIGFLTGVLGSATGVIGSMAAGVVIQRYGRKVAFYGTAIACAAGAWTLVVVALPRASEWAVTASVGLLMALWMAVATTHTTMMMDRSRGDVAGSDYTVQHGVGRLASLIGGGIGSLCAARVGTATWFMMAPIVMLVATAGSHALLRSPRSFAFHAAKVTSANEAA
jgi:MFS transporter, PAT family, beta-lactamase induction signal transducer AmpG